MPLGCTYAQLGVEYPSLLKVTTFQALPDYMGNYLAVAAVLPREEIVVMTLKFIKMMAE